MPTTDDGSDAVAFLTATLEANGYKSYAACDVRMASELISEIHPALLCLDVIIPNERGSSFHLRFRQKEELENIVVLMISGIIDMQELDFQSYAKDISAPIPGRFRGNPIDVDEFIRRMEVCWCSGKLNLRLIEYGKKSGDEFRRDRCHSNFESPS